MKIPRKLSDTILKKAERDIGHQGNRTGQKAYTLIMMLMMTTYEEITVQLHAFLLSVLDEGSISFRPRPLYPSEGNYGAHWTEGWLCSRAGLDVVEKRKITSPAENRATIPVIQPVT
jgi:hypothetical protein